MHQPREPQSPLEKWQLGISRLTKSETEPELLGLAMISLHGALEDQFRHTLASLPHLLTAEKSRVQDVSQVKWLELCNLMQRHGNLSDRDAKYIMRMNSLRIDAGHGGEFRGNYQDVAAYADFVKGWLNVTENTNITVNRSLINCCPGCQSRSIRSLKVIHDQGISIVERRRGKAEKRQSGLSLRAAPPLKKKMSSLEVVWAIFVVVVGLQIFGYIVSVCLAVPLIGGLLAFLAGSLCLVVLLLVAGYPAYRVWRFNKVKHPNLMEEWQRTFMCEQCGHTFMLETSRSLQ